MLLLLIVIVLLVITISSAAYNLYCWLRKIPLSKPVFAVNLIANISIVICIALRFMEIA